MTLLEFSADLYKDILAALREGKGGLEWSVCAAMATDTYWHHMDAERKMVVVNKSTGSTRHEWRPRSKHWPNHMFDCEVMQVVLACFLGLFSYED